MRLISVVTMLAMLLLNSSAFARSDQHRWCRQTRDGTTHCVYATLQQCKAAKEAPTETCARNFAGR